MLRLSLNDVYVTALCASLYYVHTILKRELVLLQFYGHPFFYFHAKGSSKLSSTSSPSANGSTKFSGVFTTLEEVGAGATPFCCWRLNRAGTDDSPPVAVVLVLVKLIPSNPLGFLEWFGVVSSSEKKPPELPCEYNAAATAGGAKSRGVGAEKSKLSVVFDSCCFCVGFVCTAAGGMTGGELLNRSS